MKISDLEYSVQFYLHDESNGMRVTTTDLKILEEIKAVDGNVPVDELKIGNRIYLEGVPEYKYQIKAISILEIGDRLKKYGMSSKTSEHVGPFKPYLFTVDVELELL